MVFIWGMTRSVPYVPLKVIIVPDVERLGATATLSLVTPVASKNVSVPLERPTSTSHQIELPPRVLLAEFQLASRSSIGRNQ